ncbi:MAG: cytochrome c maturation protein CcmE [Syntrophothermus sp.]
MKRTYLVGIVVILAFALFGIGTFKKSVTPYVTFAEARKLSIPVQVSGVRVPGEERYDVEEKAFRFLMQDNSGDRLEVVYDGVKPANFEEATGIVAIGKYADGVFRASQLLVKCPSKYQGSDKPK